MTHPLDPNTPRIIQAHINALQRILVELKHAGLDVQIDTIYDEGHPCVMIVIWDALVVDRRLTAREVTK
jgi:hypothetical protein